MASQPVSLNSIKCENSLPSAFPLKRDASPLKLEDINRTINAFDGEADTGVLAAPPPPPTSNLSSAAQAALLALGNGPASYAEQQGGSSGSQAGASAAPVSGPINTIEDVVARAPAFAKDEFRQYLVERNVVPKEMTEGALIELVKGFVKGCTVFAVINENLSSTVQRLT